MTPEADLSMILGVLSQRGVEIRSEACESEGGLVRIRDQQVLFLNPATPVLQRVDVALGALRRLGVEGHYLPPHVRELLEGERPEARRQRPEVSPSARLGNHGQKSEVSRRVTNLSTPPAGTCAGRQETDGQ